MPCRVPQECPAAIADLITQCMDPDPSGRPSAKEVAALLSQPDSMLDRRLPVRRELSDSDQDEVPHPPHHALPSPAGAPPCSDAAHDGSASHVCWKKDCGSSVLRISGA